MRKLSVIVMAMLFCLIPICFYAAEKDAAGCKDHPLISRMPGYYIAACNEIPAGADIDIIKGEITETVHFEGKSSVFSYMPQPDAKIKISEAQLLNDFDQAIKKMNGNRFGITYGQKWPVYAITKDGKNFWIILLVNSGKYFDGSYACRIIEKN
jgi:OmpA-OmpF porin, OOP family